MTHDNETPPHLQHVARRYALRCSADWPGTSGATSTVPARSIVHGVGDWLDRRVDPELGAPREWVVGALAWIFQVDEWKASIALATVASERRARTERIDGAEWVFPRRSR